MYSSQWRHISDFFFPPSGLTRWTKGVILDYITRSPGKLSPFGYEAGIENFREFPIPAVSFATHWGRL